VAEVALFYACDSLARQITKWARKHPGCTVKYSFARLLPEIRTVLERADVALIDATEDPAQACDAFSQAAGQLGVAATGMYSERMPDGLEVFVRSRGALMLLGPLSDAEWDGFLEGAVQGSRSGCWKKAA
jgi:hypothetical protein